MLCLRPHMALIFFLGVGFAAGQPQSRHVPAPLHVHVAYQNAWQQMVGVLGDMESPILRADQQKGEILTEFQEYSSGTLVDSHIRKIGQPPKLTDSIWVRVEYQYQVQILLIEDQRTLVTVNTGIRALERSFMGVVRWRDIPTNGRLEEQLLTAFGKRIFGEEFVLEKPKKGFWERDPVYITGPDARRPSTPGPERPPDGR